MINDISVCWNAIVNGNYSKNGRFWTLNNSIDWIGGIEIFYNRYIYDELIEMLKLNEYPVFTKTLCLIYGTSGIGKSLFLLAVLVAIVENAKDKNIPIPSIHYIHRSQTWSLLSTMYLFKFSQICIKYDTKI